MTRKANWTLCALGVIALVAFLAQLTPSAGQGSAVQQVAPNSNKAGGGKPARQAPAKQSAPKSGGTTHFNVKRAQPRVVVPHNQPKTFTRTRPVNKNITVQQKNITIQRNKNIHVRQKNVVVHSNVRKFTPKGGKSKVVITVPLRGAHRTFIAGHNYSIWTWRTAIPLPQSLAHPRGAQRPGSDRDRCLRVLSLRLY